MSLDPGTRVGPYEVSGPLGAGGMGEVYRATDTTLGRQVAIKVLPAAMAWDGERLARFEREAKTLAALNHPNIAAIYGFERTGSTTALVMELVEGPTLAERIAQGALALDDALPIATQITDALAAAHDQGIVHRDLKPANIKVRPDGVVKVLDFGLAKTIEPAVSSTAAGAALSLSPTITSPAMTEAGMLLGTAAYMSPEQARGKTVDKRADIWAFGCVLFEMLTGRRAFAGEDVTETIAAVVRDQPDLDLVPARVRRALARCLEKDPRKRLRDIGDVWSLVDDHDPAPDVRTPATPAWRRALPWGLAAVAATVAVIMSVTHLTETRVSPRPLRFQLQIPAEAGSSTPELSPDGTRVAYRAAGQIWVRDLDSLESRAVASTDRSVGRLIWSADSRFIMYSSAEKLLRVAAAGGSPETLRDLPAILAGGFGLPGGAMVLNTVADPVARVGETRYIDARGETKLANIHPEAWLERDATLLPDGKRFVYSVSEPEAQSGVYVASIDGNTTPERILPEASQVAYVPSVTRDDEGYLLLLRQDTIVALPVDAARLRARGEPVVLAKGVGRFTVSAADSLVYRSGAGRRLTWYDRRGTSTGTAWSLAPYMEFALSPDATRLVAVRADGPTTWFYEFASESSVRASATRPVVIKPVWHPDGDRATLASAYAGTNSVFLTLPASGTGEEEILRVPGIAYPTSWSPDAKWLLYTRVDPRTNEDLWVVPMTAGRAGEPQRFLVTDNKESDATFAPDGQAVAYVSDESGTSNVYVRSFPSTGGRKYPVSIGGGYQPRWRRDGRELFYISTSGQLMSVAVTPGLGSPPGPPTPLFQTGIYGGGRSLNNWYWDVTADGQRFLINTVTAGDDPSTLNVLLNWQSSVAK